MSGDAENNYSIGVEKNISTRRRSHSKVHSACLSLLPEGFWESSIAFFPGRDSSLLVDRRHSNSVSTTMVGERHCLTGQDANTRRWAMDRGNKALSLLHECRHFYCDTGNGIALPLSDRQRLSQRTTDLLFALYCGISLTIRNSTKPVYLQQIIALGCEIKLVYMACENTTSSRHSHCYCRPTQPRRDSNLA